MTETAQDRARRWQIEQQQGLLGQQLGTNQVLQQLLGTAGSGLANAHQWRPIYANQPPPSPPKVVRYLISRDDLKWLFARFADVGLIAFAVWAVLTFW